MTFRAGTWNVYVGAPFESLLGSVTTDRMVAAGGEMLDQMRASRYAERAAVIAEVIEQQAPDVIGLNELSRWQFGVGGDIVESADLEAELLGALAYLGAPYRLAASVERVDGGLPLGDDRWASVTIRDALLLRVDDRSPLQLDGLRSAEYERRLRIDLGAGLQVTVPRGWIRSTILSAEGPVEVVVTHLEAVDAAVRRAQASELAAMIAAAPRPCILLGDLNAESWTTGTGDLEPLAEAGLVDAWAHCHPDSDGRTWSATGLVGHRAFERRIDFVAATDDLTPIACSVVGAGDDTRTAGAPGLAPSDHAAVVATYERRDLQRLR
jgi:endonuclease/exonuclease/phosphatase family metal-dependent hydrolase